VVATHDSGPLREFDRLVLRQSVSIVALELLRERVARETAWRLASTLLADLARGLVTGRDLARRLGRFGLDGPITALVMPRPEPGRRPGASPRPRWRQQFARNRLRRSLLSTARF
jgi:purine catabolism regulator